VHANDRQKDEEETGRSGVSTGSETRAERVFRHVLGTSPRGPFPTVSLRADQHGLTIRSKSGMAAIEHFVPGEYPADEILVPHELLLSQSERSGDPLGISTDRRYLARALRLGFRELLFYAANGDLASLVESARTALREADSSSVPCPPP